MSISLIEINTLTNHTLAFVDVAKQLGFTSISDIGRFIFKSYSKALQEIPYADQPRGVIFLLEAPTDPNAHVSIDELKSNILLIQRDISRNIYSMRTDLSRGAHAPHLLTTEERKHMIAGAWSPSFAQLLSKSTKGCVVYASGVGVMVFLNGDIYIESLDVIEELPGGIPESFQRQSWDDGKIAFEFAKHELNDTTPAGIWCLPEKMLLRPKPEKLMSLAFGKYLRNRMAGYRHHEDEPYVENVGRADIVLTHVNGRIYIVEIKWIGKSLNSTKERETKARIKQEIEKNSRRWFTQYADEVYVSGNRQLNIYYGTGKYNRAYLVVFDCQPVSETKKDEIKIVDATHVSPHDPQNFRILRACVNPCKASIKSKERSK